MPKACPCGCRRQVGLDWHGMAAMYVQVSATRELLKRWWTLACERTPDEERRMAEADQRLQALVWALERVLHRQPQRSDLRHVKGMKEPAVRLCRRLAAQVQLLDPAFYDAWVTRSSERWRSAA